MAIECVNTIEIRLFEALDSTFTESIEACTGRLQEAPGCLDYTLSRSTREAGLWWLTGYWDSEARMTESFESVPMAQLLNCLIEAGASLSFGSFVALTATAQGN
ncbi:antibiotic biosynthesis monooxygenase [Pseudomonas sp. MAFF 302046]|jgi:quinol monooxygenase YgiN|uniref:Antibiotic biosynthesis monooxygenase n=1 Tax=Pseudomonas morbosilactucae TaxID=2938197 RepID=A0ABT0JND4_9PSED|nr:antibiotic biosynthesis monooxygenase family protein [Pseudomonas morbosilactucae]MCK9817125.1 antibiotic biosynthesis monooxygenase [Pseudomonas morbosilactucae]